MSRVSFFSGSISLLLLATSLGIAQDMPEVDANLETLSEGHLRIGRERGRRVVVIFYEDRPHLDDNLPFKRNLLRWVDTNDLDEQMVIFGVANLLRIPQHIPRFLVRSQIQPLEERWGIEIMLDWDGVMRRSPWTMRGNSSNVAIVDRRGRLVWHTVGAISGERRTSFYDTLRHYLRQ